MSKRPASVRHLFMVAIDALASQGFVVQFSRHLTKLHRRKIKSLMRSEPTSSCYFAHKF